MSACRRYECSEWTTSLACARLDARISAKLANSGSMCSWVCRSKWAFVRAPSAPASSACRVWIAPSAASRSACACDSLLCCASRSSHSSVAGASFSNSLICHCRRSRSCCNVAWAWRACSRAFWSARHCDQRSWVSAVLVPANASSKPRTDSGRVRLCQACCPWMSSSMSPSARNCAAVAGVPLIQARLFPWASTVRRSKSMSSESNPASSSQGRTCCGQSNSAQMSVRGLPSRTTPASERAPRASCKASIRMDLPAPVSPVNTVKPGWSSSSSVWTITKSRNVIRRSAMVRSLPHSNAAFCAALQNSSNPAGAGTAHNALTV